MSVYEIGPRAQWSRRVQDFHSSDPDVQAALAGERYFDVSPGHLLSSALETDYFDGVDDCLDFFGLDRDVLKRTEPFTEHEVDRLQGQIIADADRRLRPAADARYIRWAEGLIGHMLQDDDQIDHAICLLKGDAATDLSADASEEAKEIEAGTYDSAFNNNAYDERHLRLQVARAISLFERDGFAITLDVAMSSLVANGFADSSTEYYEASNYSDLKRRLSVVALYGTQLELQDGILDPEDFDLEQEDYARNFGLSVAYDCHSLGAPVVLGVKDLITFAQNYASPDKLPELATDRKTQVLTALVKNTDERIEQLRQITPNVEFSK